MSRVVLVSVPVLFVVVAALGWGQEARSERPAKGAASPAPAAASPSPAAGPASGPGAAPPAPAAPTAPTGPRTFALDGKKSQLVIQVFRAGAAARLAHDHTVHATEMSGEIVADPAAPETAKVRVTVQTKSLVNDDPVVRKQFGLDPEIPEKDRETVNENMKSEEQLDVAHFPTISFVSTAVEKNGEKLTLVGDFTLHGVTKQVKMPIEVSVAGDTITGHGKIKMMQSDWGIEPYSAFLGAVKNKDEMLLHVHLVARAR